MLGSLSLQIFCKNHILRVYLLKLGDFPPGGNSSRGDLDRVFPSGIVYFPIPPLSLSSPPPLEFNKLRVQENLWVQSCWGNSIVKIGALYSLYLENLR